MGAKYTKDISRADALASINEMLARASNNALASVLEDLNDNDQENPHGLCNFNVVDHLEDECPACGRRH
jgi:hypothetical protein